MKTLKTAFLLTALTLLLLALGQAFGGQRGMTLALMFRDSHERHSIFFLGQDRVDVQRRATNQQRTGSAAL